MRYMGNSYTGAGDGDELQVSIAIIADRMPVEILCRYKPIVPLHDDLDLVVL